MTFGEPVTLYEQFLTGTYGYILRLNTTPNIRSVVSVQTKNDDTLSDVITGSVSITDLMQYPLEANCPDIAFALESGVIYIFFKTLDYPYETDTTFLLMATRYPQEITDLDSNLDIVPEDLELFIILSIATAAEMQGKIIPQRILDKIAGLRYSITQPITQTTISKIINDIDGGVF